MFRNIVSKNLCMDSYTKKKGAKIYKGRRLNEILEQNLDQRLFNNFRMLRDTFFKLCDFCFEYIKLKSSQGVIIEEKLAIFIFVVTKKTSFADSQELFDRSKATIASCFIKLFMLCLLLIFTRSSFLKIRIIFLVIIGLSIIRNTFHDLEIVLEH